jgi:hypothetical protein
VAAVEDEPVAVSRLAASALKNEAILPSKSLSDLFSGSLKASNSGGLRADLSEEIDERPELEQENALVQIDPHWSVSVQSHLSIARGIGSAESGISGFGLGLGVDRYFEGSWSLSTGLAYARRSDMALGHRFEGATYGFGAERDVLEISAQSFSALEIPFSVGIGLGRGHRVRAGYYAAWLFDYGSESAHWHQGEGSDDWVKIASPDYDISSYFSAFDHGALLAWDYELGAWGVGLEYRHGSVDLSRGFGAAGSEDYNRALRINLSFDLDE